ncbi:MAG: CdvA-like protein [Candidatus Bathycorpusculaceae bacterium]
MISWKNSFKRLNEEYETVNKKRQALENLLNNGRISQSTFDIFNTEINEAVAEIERQQKALLDKMNDKMKELETQIRTLEMLLANFEIQHVTGEVEEEVYQREITLLSMGLEHAKHELNAIMEATNQLSNSIQTFMTAAKQEETQPQPTQVPQPETEQKPSETTVEFVEAKETGQEQKQEG